MPLAGPGLAGCFAPEPVPCLKAFNSYHYSPLKLKTMNTFILITDAVRLRTRFANPANNNPCNKPDLLNHHKKRRQNE